MQIDIYMVTLIPFVVGIILAGFKLYAAVFLYKALGLWYSLIQIFAAIVSLLTVIAYQVLIFPFGTTLSGGPHAQQRMVGVEYNRKMSWCASIVYVIICLPVIVRFLKKHQRPILPLILLLPRISVYLIRWIFGCLTSSDSSLLLKYSEINMLLAKFQLVPLLNIAFVAGYLLMIKYLKSTITTEPLIRSSNSTQNGLQC